MAVHQSTLCVFVSEPGLQTWVDFCAGGLPYSTKLNRLPWNSRMKPFHVKDVCIRDDTSLTREVHDGGPNDSGTVDGEQLGDK